MQVRVLFQNTLYQTMLESKGDNCTPMCCPYKPSKPICIQDEDEIFYWNLIPHLKALGPEKRLFTRLLFLDDLHHVFDDHPTVEIKSPDPEDSAENFESAVESD